MARRKLHLTMDSQSLSTPANSLRQETKHQGLLSRANSALIVVEPFFLWHSNFTIIVTCRIILFNGM